MKISVVVPVYGCPEAVIPLTDRLVNTVSQITNDFEIILVDDACPKGSWTEILKACEKDKRIIGIELSRNFGQMKALTAGLDICDGEWVVTMDCDLQDRPEGIIDLYTKAMEGFDVVFARRKDRKDKAYVKLFSKAFYRVYDFFTDGNYDSAVCNFCIARKEVVDNFKKIKEQTRDYTIALMWLGYNSTSIDIQADERFAGDSSYNLRKKFRLAGELITSQSVKPLLFSVNVGFVFSFISFLFLLFQIIRYFFDNTVPEGWTSIIVSVFFVGGLIMLSIGIVGIYIGNVFNEVKGRPLYVVKSIVNKEKDE